jgi:hypothetical protein
MSILEKIIDVDKKDDNIDEKQRDKNIKNRVMLIGVVALLIVIALSVLFSSVFISRSGLDACTSILLTPQRNQCIANLAGSTGNYSICSSLKNQQQSYSCIESIAVQKENLTACNMVKGDNLLYVSCVMNVSYQQSNPNGCSSLDYSNQSACAYNIASKENFSSISYCGPIRNASLKSVCNYTYYLSKALTYNQASYCSLLPHDVNSTLLSQITPPNLQNSSDIIQIEGSSLSIAPSDACYMSVALSTKNRSICGEMTTNMSAICENLQFSTNSTLNNTNSTLNSTTLNTTGIKTICGQIHELTYNLCTFTLFTDKAIVQKNGSSCLEIDNISLQNSCVVNLARNYTNSTYCNYINMSNKSAYNSCVATAQEGSSVNLTTHG